MMMNLFGNVKKQSNFELFAGSAISAPIISCAQIHTVYGLRKRVSL